MLGAMQCRFFFNADCAWAKYAPQSAWLNGPGGEDKPLYKYLDLSAMNKGDRESNPWTPNAYMCRSLFNNAVLDD